MQGASFFFSLCVGFLALSTGLVINRSRGNGLRAESFGISLKTHKALHYPELQEPTEKEWMDLLEEIQNPSLMAEKNFTVQFNDTGSFTDSKGGKGIWNETIYQLFKEKEGEVSKFSIGGTKVFQGGNTFGVVGISKTLYTVEVEGAVAEGAEVGYKASFLIHKNNTFELLEKSLGFAHSTEISDADGAREHFSTFMKVINASHVFTLSSGDYDANYAAVKDRVSFNVSLDGNHVPLSGVKFGDKLSQTPEELMQLMSERNGDLSSTFGNSSGFYTLGDKGSFGGGSQLTTFSKSGIFNFTDNFHGKYIVQDGTQQMRDFSFFDMLNSLTKGMF